MTRNARWIFAPVVLAVVLLVGVLAISAERSGHWRTVRDVYIAAHPECAACGETEGVQCHHVLDFRLFPEKELDSNNLITLCRRCHMIYGHLGDWHSFNPCVREDAARHRAEMKARPYTREDADKFWQRFSSLSTEHAATKP